MTEQAPTEVPPLTHIVRLATYADNRGILVQDRITTFGVAPRGFTRYNAAITVGFQDQHGRVRPQRVEVGIDGPAYDPAVAETEEQANARIAAVFMQAPELLTKETDRREAEIHKHALVSEIRAGAGGLKL